MSRVDAAALTAFARRTLAKAGLPTADAELVADSLVQADLWGHQSHGVMRLPWYIARLESGAMQGRTAAERIVDAGAVAVIDGHDGVGQVLAGLAMREAIDRARAHGIGAVSVRNSNHFGTLAYFSRMAAQDDCIAIVMTNASPAMAPWGGREKAIGNNPWSIAAPAGERPPMILDIANTVVARGKIFLARQKGVALPPGWAMDAEGRPTTDPVAALGGLILPMAEHKGYGISLMLDVLSGVLSGSAYGAGVNGPYQAEKRSGCGHLMLALHIAAFMPTGEFAQRMAAMIASLKSVPRAAGVDEIFYPWEIEARNDLRNRREGLDLPEDTRADLAKLGHAYGVPFEQ